MIVRSSIGFLNRLSDAELVKKVQAILLALTDNANFPDLKTLLNLINPALAAFITAMSEAAQGGRGLTTIKNAKRQELVALMRKLGNNLTDMSDGDLAKLQSSDFPIQKPTRGKIGKINAPETPTVKYTKISGSLEGKCPPVYGAMSYEWQVTYASMPEKLVLDQTSGGGRATLAGLKPAETARVQVRAIGSAGPSDWSNTVETIVV